jgi:hypothetical protein
MPPMYGCVAAPGFAFSIPLRPRVSVPLEEHDHAETGRGREHVRVVILRATYTWPRLRHAIIHALS